ncbi:hypothetical protein [Rhizobium azibense]|uniref:ATP dependent DNA ligase n=1 Tax=Rhizobium azibense TaxID=1136135 RepID=UPI00315DA917
MLAKKCFYDGSAETGFNERSAPELREAVDKLKVKKPVEYSGRSKYRLGEARLVAEVECRARSHDGKLWQSSYKGLRDPDDNAEIHEIEGQAAAWWPEHAPGSIRVGFARSCRGAEQLSLERRRPMAR